MDSFAELVSAELYGRRKANSDVLLVSLHGTDKKWRSGLETAIPGLRRFSADDEATFDEYLGLEADVGAATLAIAIARAIARKTADVCTEVVIVDVPLGIFNIDVLDPQAAMRNMVHPNYRGIALPALRRVQELVLAELDEHVARLSSQGVLLSVHTCSPWNRGIKKPAEAYGKLGLEDYIASFTDLDNRGMERKIDLVTASPDGTTFANPQLTVEMSRVLDAAGLAWEANRPFSLQEGTWQARAFTQKKSLAIDVPKDRIAAGAPKQLQRNLPHLQPDSNKVDGLANIIAKALLNCVDLR